MKYIIFKMKDIITIKKVGMIFILATLITIPIISSSNILFDENFTFMDKYIWGTNNFEFFYIPIVCLFFYFMSCIRKDSFERMYFYRFKSKKALLKVNLVVTLLFTIFYVTILNISLFLILLISSKGNIKLNDLIVLAVSIVLQILVLYIYELICIGLEYLIIKNNRIIMGVLRIFIILITALGSFISGLNILSKVSLYGYFTYLNVIESGQGILFTIGILVFINLVLYNLLEGIATRVEYRKYLDTNIEI